MYSGAVKNKPDIQYLKPNKPDINIDAVVPGI